MMFEKVVAEYDKEGKRKLVPVGGPDIFIEADDVLIAVGQENSYPWIERDLGIDFDKLHKACIYQLTLKPDSLFIDCENLEFRMVNEISKDVYDSIIEWGFDGVYDKNPYTKGGFEYNSVLEISICNVDSIEKIVKRNDLKLNIIKEILKNDTEKEDFELLIRDMIKHVDIITKEVFDVICDYYGKDVILNKTKDILENLNDPFIGLGFKAEDVQKIIDLSR